MNGRAWLPAALVAVAVPAMAQDVAATLRARGTVMVSTGGEFTSASDGQPVVAGQRLMVGDDGSATVEYGRNCKRTYDKAGVYTIPPARCDEGRDEDRSPEGRAMATAEVPWTTLAVAVGSATAMAALMEPRGNSSPDHPISR